MSASDATPAKLAKPDATVRLTEQETKEAQDSKKHARSKS
jgi:hypothetical protein